MKFKTYYIKESNHKRVIDKIMKSFIEGKIRDTDNPYELAKDVEPGEEFDLSKGTSRIKVREYLEKFIQALEDKGPMSSARDKWKGKKEASLGDMGTSVWAVNLMNELRLDTNKKGNIEKFERELTTIAGKLLGRI